MKTDVRTQDVPACVLQITLKHVSQNAWVATPFRNFSKSPPNVFLVGPRVLTYYDFLFFFNKFN